LGLDTSSIENLGSGEAVSRYDWSMFVNNLINAGGWWFRNLALCKRPVKLCASGAEEE
jgi:hypothetical protein